MIAAAFWLAMGTQALAADIGVVGAHDANLSVAEQQAWMARLERAIETGGRHTAMMPAEVSAQFAGREDLVLVGALLRDGLKQLEDGRLLYQQAELDDATAVLEQATQSLEASVRWSRSVKELWDAWMLLATAHHGAGRASASRDALAHAVALQPGRRPDPAVWPPEVIATYENEKKLGESEAASLTVALDAPGATVWLDGRQIGPAPAVVPGVLPGVHHVHVRAGDQVGYAKVTMSGGTPVVARPTLAAPVLGAAARTTGGRSSQIDALYESIGRFGRMEIVLAIGRVDDVLQVQAYHPATDTWGAPIVLSQAASEPELGVAVERLVGGLTADGALPASTSAFAAPPYDIDANLLLARDLFTPVAITPTQTPTTGPTTPPPTEPEPKVAKKVGWPVWLGVGLGVAALGGGAAALGVVLGGPDGTTGGGTIIINPPAP